MRDDVRNAIIEQARIDINEFNTCEIILRLDYGNLFQQCFLASNRVEEILKITARKGWSAVDGSAIRVMFDYKNKEKIISIGHIIKDEWISV